MLRCMRRMPRTAGVLVWTAGAVAMHAVVPLELSRLGDRARPHGPAASAARGAGLLTVAAGAALMSWALAPLPRRAAGLGAGLPAHPPIPAAARPLPAQPQPDLCRRGPRLARLGAVLPPSSRLGRAGDPMCRPRKDRPLGRTTAPGPLRRRLPAVPGAGTALGTPPSPARNGPMTLARLPPGTASSLRQATPSR
jgi:hypothetical protein